MFAGYAVFALAASITLALPQPTREPTPHDKRADSSTVYHYPNTSSLTRQNPTYTKDQLTAVKFAYTSNDRLSTIRSFGDTDDYFKYDFSPTLSGGNAGSGQGGQGLLAQVANFPVLLGTGQHGNGFLRPLYIALPPGLRFIVT